MEPPTGPPIELPGAPPGWYPTPGGYSWWDGHRWHQPPPPEPSRFPEVAANLLWVMVMFILWPFLVFVPVLVWAIRESCGEETASRRRVDEAYNTQLSGWLGLLVGAAVFIPLWVAAVTQRSDQLGALTLAAVLVTAVWVCAHMVGSLVLAIASASGRDQRLAFTIPLTKTHRDRSQWVR